MPDAGPTSPANDVPLDGPPSAGFEDFASARHTLDPEYIGHYRILQRIGEGGMGVVYVAEQREPVRRTVALKVIKLGMDSKEVVARFEAERQALALMSHPNVAKVFEAGMTEAGRPYFAMEHVPGVPLTQYCDENKSGMRARLELFIQVCHAVQHAHQKGIIHRDLKPSNVLVTMFDAKPVPKVIDFGIAKAANQHLTQHTLFTQTGSLMGTPEYMSPEQAQTGGLDVDTRSDVYSLGVILYELLTGSTPFDAKTLRGAGPEQMVRILRESEPPRPSTRLTSADADSKGEGVAPSSEIAKRRGTDAHSLRRAISGDLDWISLKAMEKDRTRRYDTANGLAADVRRHLDNEPVLARPPSTVYRWSKLARKHKAGMAAAALVALALLLGLGGTTFGFLRARVERDNALQAKATAVQAQAAEAREREAAEAVNKFLQEMLASADPNVTQGKEMSVRQALDTASKKVEQGSLKEQPDIEATVRGTLGRTYWVLAQFPIAETHLRTALDIRKRLYGNEHPKVAESLDDLGRLLRDQPGRLDESEPFLREGLAMRRKLLGSDHVDVATSLSSLAFLMTRKGDHTAAEPLYRECLAIRRKHLGPDHPHVGSTMSLLTKSLRAKGDLAGAEAMLREALAVQRKALGSEHMEVGRTLTTLGHLLWQKRDYDAAESTLRESLSIRRKLLGNDDTTQVAWALEYLGDVMMLKGDQAAAEPLYRELLAIRTKAPDYDLVHAGRAVHRYADLLREKGDVDGAETLVREHLAKTRARVGENNGTFAWASGILAWHLHLTGRSAEAEPAARQALAIHREAKPYDRFAIRYSIATLTPVLLELHQYPEAEALSRESLELAARGEPQLFEEWLLGVAKLAIGTALLGQNRVSEAEPLLQEGYEAMENMARSRERDKLQRLVKLYQALGEPDKAEKWRSRLAGVAAHARAVSTQPAAR